MKNFIYLTICLFVHILPSLCQSNFDIGFKEGFKNGYCYSSQSSYYCTPPIAPLPPLPQYNENRNNYQDGYNRGFLYGQSQRTSDETTITKRNIQQNQPQFTPYISQNPTTTLSQQQQEHYYATRARQEQAAADAFGALLENIFTLTPEERARREIKKQQRLEERDRLNELKRIKKEQRANRKNESKAKVIDLQNITGIQEVFSFAPILNKPSSGNDAQQLGYAENNIVYIIENYNNKFFKVQSGSLTGYIWIGWIKIK